MARRVGLKAEAHTLKIIPNQREVGFFLHHWKNKSIKLLPQLWGEIFAFPPEIQLHPLWFLCWCFLNLALQAKLPDGSRPVSCPGHARTSGLMDDLLPCLSDLCITAFPTVRLCAHSVGPSCMEIRELP